MKHKIMMSGEFADQIGRDRLKVGDLPGMEGVRVVGLREDEDDFEQNRLWLVFEGDPGQVTAALKAAVAL